MRNIWDRLVRRVSSRLRRLASPDNDVHDDGLTARVAAHEAEIKELRAEIDELRQDSLRIAELYDLVFERLKQDQI